MKILVCSPIRESEESVFVIKLDEDMLFHLKEGIRQSLELSKLGFKNGAILTIPYEDASISLYSFGTIFKTRLKKGTEEISTNGIEYLALDEEERYDFAKKYNIAYNYTLIDNDIPLSNFYSIAEYGHILIENGSVNFQLMDGDKLRMSETLPHDFIKANILINN